MQKPPPSSWGTFLRLWLVLAFSYFFVKLLYTIGVMGIIDLRPVALSEFLVLPFGQSVVFWTITRRGRRSGSSAPPTS